jgi:hypothetical protein
MYIKTLTQNDLIETDSGPSYQYCEAWADEEEGDGCPGEIFAGDQVVRTTEEADGMNALYCTVCYVYTAVEEEL